MATSQHQTSSQPRNKRRIGKLYKEHRKLHATITWHHFSHWHHFSRKQVRTERRTTLQCSTTEPSANARGPKNIICSDLRLRRLTLLPSQSGGPLVTKVNGWGLKNCLGSCLGFRHFTFRFSVRWPSYS